MKKIEGLGTGKILAHVEDGIGWVQFNNAEKHNALSLEMSAASVTAIEAFAADRDVRGVVLQGLRSPRPCRRTGHDTTVKNPRKIGREERTIACSPNPTPAMESS